MRPFFSPTAISKFNAMCGRYVTVTSVKAIEKRFQVTAGPGYTDAPPPPNTNVSHGDAAPVITGDQPAALQAMQFGFTPSWAKKQFYMINARSEGDHNADNDDHNADNNGNHADDRSNSHADNFCVNKYHGTSYPRSWVIGFGGAV